MKIELITKILCMLGFFFEVLIFGRCVSKLSLFQNKNYLSVALSFSGGLFISISILHIIPESTHKFNQYFLTEEPSQAFSKSQIRQSWYLPFSFIITSITFIVIMFIDKILIGQSHDDEYEISFVNQPKKNDSKIKQLDQIKQVQRGEQQKQDIKIEQTPQSGRTMTNEVLNKQQQKIIIQEKQKEKKGNSMEPFILQAGMGIHAFFECLAVGIQKTAIGVLSLAIAIFVHKWAEGLTLGLIYKKNNYSGKVITIMILIQAFLNVIGLIVGSFLSQEGPLIIAIFMSISAGTFLYISTAEVLLQQFKHPTKYKALAVILANLFITSIFFIEKMTEQED